MKKLHIFLAIIAIISLISIIVFGACTFSFGGDMEEEWSEESDDYATTKSIVDEFYEATKASTNYVATADLNGGLSLTISVDGTSILEDSTPMGGLVYYFIEDGKYYMASHTQDYKYYEEITKEEYEQTGLNSYGLDITAFFTDEEAPKGVTYETKVSGKSITSNGVTTSSGELTIKTVFEDTTTNMKVTQTNGLVTNIEIITISDNEVYQKVSIVYGDASITLPDLSTYDTLE